VISSTTTTTMELPLLIRFSTRLARRVPASGPPSTSLLVALELGSRTAQDAAGAATLVLESTEAAGEDSLTDQGNDASKIISYAQGFMLIQNVSLFFSGSPIVSF
jgi:hypothetical protein